MVLIIGPAAQAPSRLRPLSSNVRAHPVANPSKLTLADRVASAFVSAVAALITCAVFFIVLLMHGPWEADAWSSTLSLAGFITCVAATLGFVLGPERTANAFGIVWGTVEANAWQTFLLVAAILAVLVWLVA